MSLITFRYLNNIIPNGNVDEPLFYHQLLLYRES